MPVIIHELEVVPERPTEPPAGTTPPSEEAPPESPPLTSQEIRDIIRHQAARSARLRAH
jgi:hypothetical protein